MFCCKTVVIWMDTRLIRESKVEEKAEEDEERAFNNIRGVVELSPYSHQPGCNCLTHYPWASTDVFSIRKCSEILGSNQYYEG